MWTIPRSCAILSYLMITTSNKRENILFMTAGRRIPNAAGGDKQQTCHDSMISFHFICLPFLFFFYLIGSRDFPCHMTSHDLITWPDHMMVTWSCHMMITWPFSFCTLWLFITPSLIVHTWVTLRCFTYDSHGNYHRYDSILGSLY